jgi:hypothetical protein
MMFVLERQPWAAKSAVAERYARCRAASPAIKDGAKMIIGKDVVKAFKSDIEEFFHPHAKFQLQVETGGFSPSCRGVRERARIVLPADLMQCKITSLEELSFTLLVLGHETAHYMHRHNEHHDNEAHESRSIEMWADFFGTKIALVVLTIGPQIGDILNALPGGEETRNREDALASALARLANSYFSINSTNYDPAEARVSTCVAGMLSFFQVRYPMQALITGGSEEFLKAANPTVVVARALGLQQRLFKNSDLATVMVRSVDVPSVDQLEAISAVHKQIQAEQPALFQGMTALPSLWLSLDYIIPDETKKITAARNMEVLQRSLAALGMTPAQDRM